MNLSEFKVNVDDVNKTITFTKDDVIITQKELDVKDSRIIVIPNLLSDSGIVSLREQINVVLKSRDEKVSFY